MHKTLSKPRPRQGLVAVVRSSSAAVRKALLLSQSPSQGEQEFVGCVAGAHANVAKTLRRKLRAA